MEETEELKDGMDNMVNDSSAVIDDISEDNEEDNYMEEQTSENGTVLQFWFWLWLD